MKVTWCFFIFEVAVSIFYEVRREAEFSRHFIRNPGRPESERMRVMLHSYDAFLPSHLKLLFHFRVAVLSGLHNAARRFIMRNHFCAFATLTLMMKRLSTLWTHLLFILRLTIIINCWLCAGLLAESLRVISLIAQPEFDIVLYFFLHHP